jgi:hypothetical protein
MPMHRSASSLGFIALSTRIPDAAFWRTDAVGLRG